MAEETQNIGSEPIGGEASQESTSTTAGETLHYANVEEADKAARKFQGEYDKAKHELDTVQTRLQQFGQQYGRQGLDFDQLVRIAESGLAVAQMDGFSDFVNGNLVPKGAVTETQDDSLLTDEEREIRDLKKKLADQDSKLTQLESNTAMTQAEARFERSKDQVVAKYIPREILAEREPQMLEQIRKFAASGLLNDLGQVNPLLVMKAFYGSFNTEEELVNTNKKIVQLQEQTRIAGQQQKETGLPTQESSSTPAVERAKNFKQAWDLGKKDRERAQATQ